MTRPAYRLPNSAVPVLVSADSPELMRRDAAALLSYTETHPDAGPDRIAEMIFRTRSARKYRALPMAADRDQLTGALRAVIDARTHPHVVTSTTPAAPRRLAYVFPGQGGQRPGMGSDLLRIDSGVPRRSGPLCAGIRAPASANHHWTTFWRHRCRRGQHGTVQPALFMQMVGLAAMWRSFGIDADAVTIGHSQGEVAAAYLSGNDYRSTDAVLVVGHAGAGGREYRLGDYAMAVVAADRDDCEERACPLVRVGQSCR